MNSLTYLSHVSLVFLALMNDEYSYLFMDHEFILIIEEPNINRFNGGFCAKNRKYFSSILLRILRSKTRVAVSNMQLLLPFVQNLQFMQCLNALVRNENATEMTVVIVNSSYITDLPVIQLDRAVNIHLSNNLNGRKLQFYIIDYEEINLWKFFDSVKYLKYFTSSAVFLVTHKNIDLLDLKVFQQYFIRNTVFINSITTDLHIFGLEDWKENQLRYLGNCSDLDMTHLQNDSPNVWIHETVNICYPYDPPYAIDADITKPGIALDVHSLLWEIQNFKVNFRKIHFVANISENSNILYDAIANRLCDYHSMGTLDFLDYSFDFTVFYITDYLSWYVPSPLLVSNWKYAVEIFSIQVWVFLLSTWIITAIFWYVVKIATDKQRNLLHLTTKFCLLLKLFVEQNVRLRSRNFTEVLLFIIIIFENFIINVIYKCRFPYYLSGLYYIDDIKTIEDAMKQNLKIGYLTLWTSYLNHNEQLKEYVKTNYQQCDRGYHCLHRSAFDRDIAVLRANHKAAYISHRYITEDGRSLIRKLDGAIIIVSFAAIFSPGHPMFDSVKRQILNLLSHGFVQRIISKYVVINTAIEKTSVSHNLTVYHLKLLFILWAIGIICSILALVCEGNLNKRKKIKTLPSDRKRCRLLLKFRKNQVSTVHC
ncbi:hypothetical protein HHI36_017579 [Cryptolaemus montrouzieri]|uniref:Ionotropic receptor n=1 Tax=Cryptolaemus montrouzieri TaxID=559131 RepID=A0ABD2NMY8_9CUCU